MVIYSKMESAAPPPAAACLLQNMKWKLNIVYLWRGGGGPGGVGSVASNRLCFLPCKRRCELSTLTQTDVGNLL